MIGNARVIFEVQEATGQDPSVQIDTDELSPPTFESIVVAGEQRLQIAPADSDIAVTVPASCQVLVVSDNPVLFRLQTGETQMRIRRFYLDAEDESGAAMPARTFLFSGNGASTANVIVRHNGQVT